MVLRKVGIAMVDFLLKMLWMGTSVVGENNGDGKQGPVAQIVLVSFNLRIFNSTVLAIAKSQDFSNFDTVVRNLLFLPTEPSYPRTHTTILHK